MGNTELSVALAAGGWNVIGLGQGDFRALRSFGRMSKFQGQLVTDAEPKLPAYQLLGAVEKGKDGCSFACEQAFIGLYHGLKKVVFEGRTDLTAGLTKQNFVIQGGCLLVNAPLSGWPRRGVATVYFALSFKIKHRAANRAF